MPLNLPETEDIGPCYKVLMRRDRLLAAVAAGQLGLNVAGLVVAVRRHYPFEIPGWSGSPDHVVRDALWMGTALSAPAPMIVAQAVSTAALARGPSPLARRVLCGLGLAMTLGYPIERHIRHRLTRGGWDRMESPLLLAGLALAVAMAGAGAPSAARKAPA